MKNIIISRINSNSNNSSRVEGVRTLRWLWDSCGRSCLITRRWHLHLDQEAGEAGAGGQAGGQEMWEWSWRGADRVRESAEPGRNWDISTLMIWLQVRLYWTTGWNTKNIRDIFLVHPVYCMQKVLFEHHCIVKISWELHLLQREREPMRSWEMRSCCWLGGARSLTWADFLRDSKTSSSNP